MGCWEWKLIRSHGSSSLTAAEESVIATRVNCGRVEDPLKAFSVCEARRLFFPLISFRALFCWAGESTFAAQVMRGWL
jgi:hypothetical protein